MPATAATPLGSQQIMLSEADFKVPATIHSVAGVLSTAAKYRVPHQGLIRLYANRPYGMYLMASDFPAAYTQLVTPTATYSWTLSGLPAHSTRVNAATEDVVAYAWDSTTTDTAWTPLTVSSIDYGTGSITVDLPVAMQTAGDIIALVAFYLGSQGGVSLGAQAPAGSDEVIREIWGSPIRGLHETDQAAGKTAPLLGAGRRTEAYGIPEGWEVLLRMDSTDTYYWGAPPVAAASGASGAPAIPAPPQYLYLPGEMVRLAVHDSAQLNLLADRHLAS